MPSTEIDEIFASKSKLLQDEIILAPTHKRKAKATPGFSADTGISRKKRKKRHRSTTDEDASSKSSLPEDVTSLKRKCSEPETIIDFSASIGLTRKRKNGAGQKEPSSRKADKKPTHQDGFEKFRDSRGQGPRMSTIQACGTLTKATP